MTIEELLARQSEIRTRLQEIDTEFAGEALPDDTREEWNRLNGEFETNAEQLSELEARRDRVASLSDDDEHREGGAAFHTPRASTRGDDIYDLSTVRASVSNPEEAARELRDRALRATEQAVFPHERANHEDCQGVVQRLLDLADAPDGQLARRILMTGSPAYRRAFGKAMAGQPLSNDEQRALSSAGAGGGFAVPFTLDPTIIPTSNSSVNPFRAISRVVSIVTDTWQGVTSAGVTASRAAEADEAGDNAPTLAQPEITPTRVQAFIPFSVEIGQDWSGLQAEMARLLQDAKDEEEATSFATGNGTPPNPQGVVTGSTNTVNAGAGGTFAVGHLYALEEALPPRYRPRAGFVGNRAIYNKVRQFDTAGGANLWVYLREGLANQVPAPGNTGAMLIGYPANEASAMAAVTTVGAEFLILGDFSRFVIVDRVGMNVELVPHLFGANRRPTGQRGIYAIWRNASEVVDANAFRSLLGVA